jgi:YegS/Rv2252/BmrU family lipid kinase
MKMRKRIKLIANPISGGDARPAIKKAICFLDESGVHVDLFLTGKRGDATEEAAALRPADYDLVIAAGGDGTLNEVANGLVSSGIPLAFLPLGTANVMALEMGIPRDIEAACRVALFGETRPVTLAESDDGFFLMMAGVGFDAAAVRAVSGSLKRRTGKFAYLVAGLRALVAYRPVALQLRNAEGEKLQVWHAIISNIRLYGGRFVLAPDAGLNKPTLSACLVEKRGRLALVIFWLRILLRGHLLGDVRRIESTIFEISGPVAPLQIDGDDYGDTPLKIHSRSGLLEMVFPS